MPKDRTDCPTANPCLIIKRRWSRLAKLFMDTKVTGNEVGTSYCLGKDGKLTTAAYCTGGKCQVTVKKCQMPLQTLGTVHTHPYRDDYEARSIMRYADTSGELYHSAGDLHSAIYMGEKFSCVLLNNGLGECITYRNLTDQEKTRALARIPKRVSAGVSSEEMRKAALSGRCKLDIRGKHEGEWMYCEAASAAPQSIIAQKPRKTRRKARRLYRHG